MTDPNLHTSVELPGTSGAPGLDQTSRGRADIVGVVLGTLFGGMALGLGALGSIPVCGGCFASCGLFAAAGPTGFVAGVMTGLVGEWAQIPYGQAIRAGTLLGMRAGAIAGLIGGSVFTVVACLGRLGIVAAGPGSQSSDSGLGLVILVLWDALQNTLGGAVFCSCVAGFWGLVMGAIRRRPDARSAPTPIAGDRPFLAFAIVGSVVAATLVVLMLASLVVGAGSSPPTSEDVESAGAELEDGTREQELSGCDIPEDLNCDGTVTMQEMIAFAETGHGAAAGSTDECAHPARVDGRPAVRTPDRRTMEIVSQSVPFRRSYLRSGTGLTVSIDGRIRWAYTNDGCRGWGLRLAVFEPSGRDLSLESDGCVAARGAVNAQAVTLGDATVACWQTHAPELNIACGRLGEDHEHWEPGLSMGSPRSFILGAGANEWLLVDTLLDQTVTPSLTGSRTLRTLHHGRAETSSVSLEPRGDRFDVSVGRVGEETWIARASEEPDQCLRIERVRGGHEIGAVRVPVLSLGGASAQERISSIVGVDGRPDLLAVVGTATAARSDLLYLLRVSPSGADAVTTALGEMPAGTVRFTAAVSHGEDLFLGAVNTGGEPTAAIIRTSSDGTVRESFFVPRELGTELRSMAYDASGDRLYVVVSRTVGANAHEVRALGMIVTSARGE